MASRIFVKNLPPNLKEEDFKKHFSGLALVTDTKFFPRRRIGYIGYKTPEIALKAIKYYNKSFIRMSKINVELARSSDEVQPRKKPKFDNDQQIHDMDSQGHQFDDAPNPKLQEFLSTMKPSSKGKTWGNEDSLTSGQPLPQTVIVEQGKIDSSDEDYRSISKKRKRQDNHGTHSEGSDGINMLTQAEHNNPKVVDDAKTRTVIPIEDSMQVDERMVSEKQVDLPPTTTSDSEWMRSKTSRLLGLVDDDEFARETQRPLNGQQDKAELSESEAENGRQQLVVYDKKDHTDDSGHDEITEQIDASQKMLGTARLFLRNLSYQTSETELEKHFANYGSIEEVKKTFRLLLFLL